MASAAVLVAGLFVSLALGYVLFIWRWTEGVFLKQAVVRVFQLCGCSRYAPESSPDANPASEMSQVAGMGSLDVTKTWIRSMQNAGLDTLLNGCSLVLQEDNMVQRLGEFQRKEDSKHPGNKQSVKLSSNNDTKVGRHQPSEAGDIEEGVMNDLQTSAEVDDNNQDMAQRIPIVNSGEVVEFENKDEHSTHQYKKPHADQLSDGNTKSRQNQLIGACNIEEGILNGLESPGAVEGNDQDMSQYTHIVVPSPGSGMNDHQRSNSEATNAKNKREVAIFCAICLEKYSIGDKVTFSANPECTHVFHRECIGRWLMSTLKKKASKIGSQEPPNTLALECPMCRQDFIELPAPCDTETDMVLVPPN